MSGKIPVTTNTVMSGGAAGQTVLTSAQAAQLLEKLRGIGNVGQGQTIKIQTIQTNPQTGAKQIIAIPIQTATSTYSGQSARLSVSPLKMVKTSSATGANLAGNRFSVAEPGLGTTTSFTSLTPAPRTVMIGSPRTTATTIAGGGGVAGGSGQVCVVKPQQVQTVLTPHKVVESHNSSSNNQNYISPILDHSGNTRKRVEIDFDSFSDSKRRKTEKGGKGLRHFSMKVCEKVQAKGSTSYNEVADELVAELTDRCQSPTDQQYDQKNIRRRVYDALNVLMAMNIISKEKKEIRWLGLPTNSVQEACSLESDKSKRIERIKAKTQQLQDLILQQIAFKNLVERNKEAEKMSGSPTPNSAIQLPFIIVNTSKKTVIDCSISNDKMEYLFNFDNTFEIHDDMEVLKRMGMALGLEKGSVTHEDLLRARNMVPRALEQYVVQLAQHGPGACAMPKVTAPMVRVKEDPGSDPEDLDDMDEPDDSDVDIN